MEHKRYPLNSIIEVDNLVYVNKVPVSKGYWFDGERHDFYELQYCPSGHPIIHQSNMFYQMSPGEISIFKPNELHVLSGDGMEKAELVVISFSLSKGFEYLASDLLFDTNKEQKDLIDLILKSVNDIFVPVPHAPDKVHMLKRECYSGIVEQKIKVYLELLLLSLVEMSKNLTSSSIRSKSSSYSDFRNKIKDYMYLNRNRSLTLADFSRDLGLSKTLLKKCYKELFNSTIMHDFNLLRAMEAKEHIVSTKLKIYEISEIMGFDNVYYFSYFIKKIFNKTPLELRKESPKDVPAGEQGKC